MNDEQETSVQAVVAAGVAAARNDGETLEDAALELLGQARKMKQEGR